MSFDLEKMSVPSPLANLPGWLMWRYETFPNEVKPRKVPYWVNGRRRSGEQGGPIDRENLTVFHRARTAAIRQGMDGVGLAMLPDWEITALDFDNCVSEGGEVPDDITSLLQGTYSEISPSGKGVRAFVRGNLGNHKAPTTDSDYGFETFSTKGYVTLTGELTTAADLLGYGDKIIPASQAIKDLCERRFGVVGPRAGVDPEDPLSALAKVKSKLGATGDEIEEMLTNLDPDMGRDEWIRVGMAIHHETDGSEDGFWLWDEWSSNGVKYDGDVALREQWDSFTRRNGGSGQPVTLATVKKWAQEQGLTMASPADFADLVKKPGEDEASSEVPRYPIMMAGDVASLPPPEWLVEDVIPKADLVVLYGPPGSGKSFVALDIAASIARGEEWRGRWVQRGRVLYIAAEGGGGYGKRIKAYCSRAGISSSELDLGVITVAPDFLDGDSVRDLIRAAHAAGPWTLVVVDTLAQVTPGGNENSAEDMGKAIAHAKTIRQVLGATVVLVHHSGKDATKGARGWSGLKGAADAEIEIQREEDDPVRQILVRKQKDGEDGAKWGFKLDVVKVGTDSRGKDVTSCVVVDADLPVKAVKSTGPKTQSRIERFGKHESALMEVLKIMTNDDGLCEVDVDDARQTYIDMFEQLRPGEKYTGEKSLSKGFTRALESLSRKSNPPFAVERGKIIILWL